MTSFVNDSGQVLEYSGADLGITKQAASFYDFKIKGDYTYNFSIPNSSVNREILGYYGSRQIGSGAYSRQAFKIIKDGNVLLRGYVVIQSSDEVNINCFFVSGNANWFQLFQFSLKEIDFADRFTVPFSDIDSRKAATEGIVYPLIDWAYNGLKRSYAFVHGVSTAQPVVEDWFPCVYLHTVVSQMAIHAGVKIDGTLIDDPLYRSIIITPAGPQLKWPKWIIDTNYAKVSRSATVAMTATSQALPMDSLNEYGNYTKYNTSTYTWTATRTALVRIELNISTNTTQAYRIYTHKNGVTLGTNDQTPSGPNFTCFVFMNVSQGDECKIFIEGVSSGYNLNAGSSAYWHIEERANGAYRHSLEDLNITSSTLGLAHDSRVCPQALLPAMKGVDLIKFLTSYFGAVCTFTDESKTLTINIVAKKKKENAKDWSKYYISHLERWDTGACSSNHVEFQDVDEAPVTIPTYGGGDIQTDFTIKDLRQLYDIPFGPSIDNANKTQLGFFLPFIQFYKLTVTPTVAATVTAVASGGSRILSITTTDSLSPFNVYYFRSSSGYYDGFMKAKTSSTLFGVDYLATDTGTIYNVEVSEIDSVNRLLVAYPGQAATITGGPATFSQWKYDDNTTAIAIASIDETTFTTGVIAWFDKPKLGQPADIINESLAIDKIANRTYNHSIAEKYYEPIKTILNAPRIEAQMVLPSDVFLSHDFSEYIYIKTETLTGYFLVQSIENYKDSRSVVKVNLFHG